MVKKNVQDKEDSKFDYKNLPSEVEEILEPKPDITSKEAMVNFDGKQFLVRFPIEISQAIGVKKGDKVKFTVTIPSPKTSQKEVILIEYVRA